MADPSTLSLRERVFVQEYLVDSDATKAASRAGYSIGLDSTDPTPDQLITRPDIASAILSGREQKASRANMQRETVLHEVSMLALSSLDHYVIDDNGYVRLAEGAPEGAIKALQSSRRRVSTRTDKDGSVTKTVDTEIKLWDKVGPLRLMGREVGLFADRIEHVGKNGGAIQLADVSKLSNEELKRQLLELAAEAEKIDAIDGYLELEPVPNAD